MSKSPYEHLPMPAPRDFDPGPAFFYKNFAKPLIEDFIDIMNAGLHIDEDAVEDLRVTVDEVLETVTKVLEKNKIVQRYHKHIQPQKQKEYADKCTENIRTLSFYLKPYKPGDMVHRTWIVNTYLKTKGWGKDQQKKWAVKDLKDFNKRKKDPFLQAIINKRKIENKYTKEGMRALAAHKLELWNRPRYEKAQTPVDMEPFNPGSAKQKQELFAMLGIESKKKSKKTGDDSWDRKAIEELQKETTDEDLNEFLQACIDHSFGAIIKNNFLAAFDTFIIDGVLHGNLKLFGAKSFRPTSNSPNLLNMPSTQSIYAKPLKRCFIAPNGKVVYTPDLGALEDRVIANLSDDTNKKNIFLEGLDGHSLNACGYFADKIEKILGPNTDNVEYVKRFYSMVDEDERLDKIRFDSKAPTFKLAYGGYPDADKGGVITEEIFHRYHNVLYPGITNYRENYVLKTCREQGYIHLGLGCRIYTSNADDDIRTLHNATVQFWSILTLIAVNEFRRKVREEKLENHVSVVSTIYDSIYSYVTAEPEIIKWVNDTLIPIMCVQYLETQPIENVAEGFIGRNFADLQKLPNDCSTNDIIKALKALDEQSTKKENS